MATSCTTLVRDALRAIADADGPIGTAGTLRYLCNRTTRIMVPWRTVAAAQKPVLAVQVVSNGRIDGSGDRRRVLVTVAAFAEGSGAQDKVEAMTQRLREILTPQAFQALNPSLDAAVEWGGVVDREVDVITVDATVAGTPVTLVCHSDIDVPILISAPQ